jgi:NhaP-type Na+/H+ and K+/H+ antiporter
MRHGSGSVRLGETGLLVLPRVCGLRSSRPRRVPYSAMVSVCLREGRNLERGTLTIVLREGECIVIPFAAHQAQAMFALYSDLWPRAQAPRVDNVSVQEADRPAENERLS